MITIKQNLPSGAPITLAEDERLDEVNESIRLIQKKHGLTFGTDAYLLAAYVRKMPRADAVDLGSGTGIIPLLLLAKEKVRTVHAVEIQPQFAELIAKNASLNGVSDRLHPLCADVRTLRPADFGHEVALVVSNPPYMKTASGKRNEHDEKFIARHEVCGNISDFCACAGRILKHGGRFVCVWRPDRLTELLNAMHSSHLEPKRMTFVHADGSAPPSSVLIEAVKGAAPSLQVTPPLFLYLPQTDSAATRELTPEAKKIYGTCSFFD
ncbi:MAG: methyltransferase [Clostridia bacterium]|nr:methyltransferase [Clostridia bacterium]